MDEMIQKNDGIELSQLLFEVEMEMDDNESLSTEIDIEWYRQKAIYLINLKWAFGLERVPVNWYC